MNKKPICRERVRLEILLDKDAANRNAARLKAFGEDACDRALQLGDGDALRLTYFFNMEYLGNVRASLSAIRKILKDRRGISSVDLAELSIGESVLVTLLDEVRALQRELSPRQPDAGKKPRVT